MKGAQQGRTTQVYLKPLLTSCLLVFQWPTHITRPSPKSMRQEVHTALRGQGKGGGCEYLLIKTPNHHTNLVFPATCQPLQGRWISLNWTQPVEDFEGPTLHYCLPDLNTADLFSILTWGWGGGQYIALLSPSPVASSQGT